MDTDLVPIKAALADMTDAELNALIEATYKAEQIAPGLVMRKYSIRPMRAQANIRDATH